jgi:hypothetical protein
MMMRLLTNALVALALLSSCKAATQTSAAPAVSEIEKISSNAAEPKDGDPASAFQSDGRKKSPFTQETVVKLNAIVGRSKAAIDEFDEIAPKSRAAVAQGKKHPSDRAAKAGAQQAIVKIESLHAQAVAAKADLASAGRQLEESRVYYDKIIFAGMTLFTEKVEAELAEEVNALKK